MFYLNGFEILLNFPSNHWYGWCDPARCKFKTHNGMYLLYFQLSQNETRFHLHIPPWGELWAPSRVLFPLTLLSSPLPKWQATYKYRVHIQNLVTKVHHPDVVSRTMQEWTLTRRSSCLKTSDSVLVLQCGKGPCSDYVVKILGVDITKSHPHTITSTLMLETVPLLCEWFFPKLIIATHITLSSTYEVFMQLCCCLNSFTVKGNYWRIYHIRLDDKVAGAGMVITINAMKTQTFVASKHQMNACSLPLYYAVFT